MGTCSGEANSFIAGVRSPPLHGGTSRARRALRGRPWDNAQSVFLGGVRSPRPQVRAGRKPGEVMITDGRAKGWWPRGENIWIGPMPSRPGVRSPPLHKMANRCDGRLRGKPGDGAEGGFLGGTRSPRPDCKAELAPWHSISTRWGARGGWPTGDMSRTNPCHPPGVRSPLLRGEASRNAHRLAGKARR